MDGATERRSSTALHLPCTRTTAVWAAAPAAFSARQVYAPLCARSRSATANIEVKASICTGFRAAGGGGGDGDGDEEELRWWVGRGALLHEISIGSLPWKTEQVRESRSPRWRASGTVKGWILGDTGDEPGTNGLDALAMNKWNRSEGKIFDAS